MSANYAKRALRMTGVVTARPSSFCCKTYNATFSMESTRPFTSPEPNAWRAHR